MKILIENYKNIKIEFDKDDEMFYCSINDERGKGSKSYASIKKYIDDYIKENSKFEPFFVVKDSLWNSEKDGEIFKIVGIRKDERFIYEDKKGTVAQISEYNEEEYIVYYEKFHMQYFATMAYLKTVLDDATEKLNAHKKTNKGKNLKEIKKDYLFKIK